jgi:hypothetical protein
MIGKPRGPGGPLGPLQVSSPDADDALSAQVAAVIVETVRRLLGVDEPSRGRVWHFKSADIHLNVLGNNCNRMYL